MIPADPSEPKFTRSYPPPRPPSSFPWGQVAALVLFFGVAGWAWYHFEWQRRLPQEHTFTDSQGKSIEARIEGRAGDVIKYTLLADNTVHFVPIASLAAADQDFANRFSSNLELSYPLECFMGDKDHPAAAIRVEGRNDDWVRYTSLADRIVHYEPLLSFSNDDQTVLKLLSRHLPVDVPLDKAFHDTSGQRLGDRVEGRSRELVQLSSPGQPALYYPIHDLAPLDKNLASLLPYSFELRFPYECILTDKNGKKLNVRMEGRSASMVKYTLLADGQAYYAPMTDFSLVDCEVFRALPSDLSFAPPLNYNLVDAQGRVIPATIEGRTDKLVKYTSSDSGRIYFSAIKGFSSDTQNFLNLVPSTLRVNYPLEATLTSAAGQELQASILGHDSASVQFSLPDGKIYTYAMAKLAPASQEFLQMLPAYSPAQTVTQSELKRVNTDTQIQPLLDNLTSLMQKDTTLLGKLAIAKTQAMTRGSRQGGGYASASVGGSTVTTMGSYSYDSSNTLEQLNLDSNRDAIANACKQINPLLDAAPKQGDAKLAQGAWSRAMGLVRQIDQLRGTITSATDSESNMHRNELRAKQADLITALNEVNRLAGAYAPVGAY